MENIIVNSKDEVLDPLFPAFTLVKFVMKTGVRIVAPNGIIFDKMADGPGNWRKIGECTIRRKSNGDMGYEVLLTDRTQFQLDENMVVGCLRLNEKPKDSKGKLPAKPESIEKLKEKLTDRK